MIIPWEKSFNTTYYQQDHILYRICIQKIEEKISKNFDRKGLLNLTNPIKQDNYIFVGCSYHVQDILCRSDSQSFSSNLLVLLEISAEKKEDF